VQGLAISLETDRFVATQAPVTTANRWLPVLLTALWLASASCAARAPGAQPASAPDAASGKAPSAPLDRVAANATEILLIGTSHFAGSQTDTHSSKVDDVLSPKRQAELDGIARDISRWRPQVVFVECDADQQSDIDDRYAAYRSGRYDPVAAGDRNEMSQLGFRIADKAGIDTLTCVDADGLWLGGRAMKVANEHNPDVVAAMDKYKDQALEALAIGNRPLGEHLVTLNSEDALWANHKAYIYYFARVGSFDATGMITEQRGDFGGARFALAEDVPDQMRSQLAEALPRFNAELVDGNDNPDYLIFGDRDRAAAYEPGEGGPQPLNRAEFAALVQAKTEFLVGFPDHHIGADLVAEWYKRNLRIYANIWRALTRASAPAQRAVVLFGQGHIWTLRTFFRENPDFRVVPLVDVLEKSAVGK